MNEVGVWPGIHGIAPILRPVLLQQLLMMLFVPVPTGSPAPAAALLVVLGHQLLLPVGEVDEVEVPCQLFLDGSLLGCIVLVGMLWQVRSVRQEWSPCGCRFVLAYSAVCRPGGCSMIAFCLSACCCLFLPSPPSARAPTSIELSGFFVQHSDAL